MNWGWVFEKMLNRKGRKELTQRARRMSLLWNS